MSKEFYGSLLRDGPKAQLSLKEVMPGLTEKLHAIVAKSFSTNRSAESYQASATDAQARFHYIQVQGFRERNERTHSRIVRAHVDVFFKHMFPALQAFWGDETQANLMVICGYGYAVSTHHRTYHCSNSEHC